MFGIAATLGINMTPIEGLVFGIIISAVDPVAVLAVFEEVGLPLGYENAESSSSLSPLAQQSLSATPVSSVDAYTLFFV